LQGCDHAAVAGWQGSYALRFLFATRPAMMGRVLGIVYRTLATHQIRKAGHTAPNRRDFFTMASP
jgi:hypothetical protein